MTNTSPKHFYPIVRRSYPPEILFPLSFVAELSLKNVKRCNFLESIAIQFTRVPCLNMDACTFTSIYFIVYILFISNLKFNFPNLYLSQIVRFPCIKPCISPISR